MRQAITIAVVLAVAVQARADVSWSSVVGDAITVATISPGGTCTYGGFSVTMDPLVGSTVSSNFCFPGNTGPTGATGAAGQSIAGFSESPGSNCATGGARFYDGTSNVYACNGAVGATGSSGSQGVQGPPGATFAYIDDDDVSIPGMYRLDGEAAYWDGYASWAYDATTGALQTPSLCASAKVTYDESDCSGEPFMAFEARNLVRCARSGAGVQTYWRQTSSYTHGGSCWAWNGSTCASTGCPGASALVVSAGSAPDLSGYAAPWTVVVED